MTSIQKEYFRNISGYDYESVLSGCVKIKNRKENIFYFLTNRPHNKDDWTLSPFIFAWTIDKEDNFFVNFLTV